MEPGDNDPESIAYIGHAHSPPEIPPIDMNQPVWMIEIFYSRDVSYHTVNASNREEAIAKAMAREQANNIPIYGVERIIDTCLDKEV